MTTRIPESPPIITKVPENTWRPLWSVMIPVYNCLNFLEETIECILLQDPGAQLMQIEVIDDCSTDGDVEALVYRVGKGRVGYYRQPYNKGSLRNFETCINRAKGKWIHLLHGDDKVKQGFYAEIKRLFIKYPLAGAAFTRHKVMDALGKEYIKINPKVGHVANEEGILKNWLSIIAQRNRLQPPAIVVKRSVYEHLGSFYAVHFGEDWEMWVRIAAHYPVAYSPKYLSVYRMHTNSITNRSFSSGQTIKDIKKVIQIIKKHLPEADRQEIYMKARKNTSWYVIGNTYKAFEQHGKIMITLEQAFEAFLMHPSLKNFYLFLKLIIKVFLYKLIKLKAKKPGYKESAIWHLPKIADPKSSQANFRK